MTISISIRYFAQLKELAGKPEETLNVADDDTARSIYYQLMEQYNFPLSFDSVRVAINDDFVSSETDIHEGDTIVFIPPVAGG